MESLATELNQILLTSPSLLIPTSSSSSSSSANVIANTYPNINTTSNDKSASKRILRFNIIAAKGIYIESSDVLLKAQIHVIFREQVLRSNEIVLNSLSSSDITFNFTADFVVNDIDFSDLTTISDADCPVLLLLTTSGAPVTTGRSEDSLAVGISQSRALRAIALLDCRLAVVHSTSFMSAELMPTDLDGVMGNGASAGLLYLQISLLEDGVVQDIVSTSVIDGAAVGAPSSTIAYANDMMQRYQARLAVASSENYLRAKTWWTAVRRDFPWVESRDIKLVANDECGQQRFVCAFIHPIAPPREVNSPREAARFVSLIPFTRTIGIAGGRVSKWRSPFALLTAMQGDIEDHAILLCSLLLGWGMDAWVAMGSILVPASGSKSDTYAEGNGTSGTLDHPSSEDERTKKPHWWVVTLDAISDNRVVFWESLTGQQYDIALDATTKNRFVKLATVPQSGTGSLGLSRPAANAAAVSQAAAANSNSESHPFCEVFALFRSDVFLLNTQKQPALHSRSISAGSRSPSSSSSSIISASFDVHDTKYWVRFPFHEADLLRHPGSRIRLSMSPANFSIPTRFTQDVEENIESAIKKMIAGWRLDRGLQTRFDDSISLVLRPALTAYELDRSQGGSITNGNADFQCAVRQLVRRGECFKAFPTCFSHSHIPQILQVLSTTSVVRDIVCAKSSVPTDQAGGFAGQNSLTKHGIRVKMFMYPEGLCAVWVMIAVTFFDRPK